MDEMESIVISEIILTVRDKYHLISPLTGTKSIEEKRKQNITRDIEVKNNVTMVRGKLGRDNEERGLQELL